MLTILFENTAQVMLNMRMNGEQVQNNLFFQHTGSIDAADLSALNADVLDWWQNEIAPLVNLDLTIDNLYAVDRTLPTGAYSLVNCVSPCVGTVSADALPNTVAAVVEFLTARRGRAFRGRNFVPAIPETLTTQGLLTAAAADNYEGAYENLTAYVDAVEWTHVVASAAGHPASGTFTGQTEPITVYRCSRVLGSRRSRKIHL